MYSRERVEGGVGGGSCTIVNLKRFKVAMTLALTRTGYSMLTVSSGSSGIRSVTRGISCTIGTSIHSPKVLRSLKIRGMSITIVTMTRGVRTDVATAVRIGRLKIPFIVTGTVGSLRNEVLRGVKTSGIVCPRRSVNVEITEGLLSDKFISVFRLSSSFDVTRFGVPQR